MERISIVCCVLFLFLASSVSIKSSEGPDSVSAPNPVVNVNTNSSIYSYIEVGGNISQDYSWVEVQVNVVDPSAHSKLLSLLVDPAKLAATRVNASFFVEQPVYISLTTMASRMKNINTTLLSLIQARIVPDKIYLVISKDPYLLDTGVTDIPDHILCLAAAGYVSIIYTSNQGPHRKLLPALKRYWNKDVFIATVDDDMSHAQGYIILYQLLKTYVLNNRADAVVALRARRISICNAPPHRATKYFSWSVVLAYGRQEMLLMPTGTGGILYKPSYFHHAVFTANLRRATGTADDLMFRLATMMKRVPVALGCSVMYHKGKQIRSCKPDRLDRLFDMTYGESSSVFYKGLLDDAQKRMSVALKASKSVVPAAKSARAPAVPVHRVVTVGTQPQAAPPKTIVGRLADMQHAARDFMMGEDTRVLTARPSDCDRGTDVVDPHGKGVDFDTRSTVRRLASDTNLQKDLFSINQRGGNDHAWKMALRVLKTHNFSFEDIAKEYMSERGEACFASNRTLRVERVCGLYDCGNAKGKL